MDKHLALALLIALFGWANRFAGGGYGWQKLAHDHGGPLRGAGAFWAGLGAALGSTAIGFGLSPTLALPMGLIGFLWGAARSIPFINDSATPDTIDEVAAAFGRFAVLALAGQILGIWADLPNLGLCLLVSAAGSTVIAMGYAGAEREAFLDQRPIKNKLNTYVETAQGALVGVAIWMGVTWI